MSRYFNELRIYINQLLGSLFSAIGVTAISDKFIIWATERIHDLVRDEFKNDRLGESFIQQATLVTNRILLKLQDGEITKEEGAEILSLVKRFYQIWSVYRDKRSRKAAKTVISFLREVERAV